MTLEKIYSDALYKHIKTFNVLFAMSRNKEPIMLSAHYGHLVKRAKERSNIEDFLFVLGNFRKRKLCEMLFCMVTDNVESITCVDKSANLAILIKRDFNVRDARRFYIATVLSTKTHKYLDYEKSKNAIGGKNFVIDL